MYRLPSERTGNKVGLESGTSCQGVKTLAHAGPTFGPDVVLPFTTSTIGPVAGPNAGPTFVKVKIKLHELTTRARELVNTLGALVPRLFDLSGVRMEHLLHGWCTNVGRQRQNYTKHPSQLAGPAHTRPLVLGRPGSVAMTLLL